MVTKTYDTAAALSLVSESPIMLPTLLPPTTAPVSIAAWLPCVELVPSTRYGTHAGIKAHAAKTTGVFAVPSMDATSLVTASVGTASLGNGDPRSRQAKQAAPPREKLR